MPPVTPAPAVSSAVSSAVIHSTSINWPALWGIAIGLASILMVVLGLSKMATAGKGKVKEAGHASAVAGIGLAWVTFGIIGAGVAISLVSGLFSTLTGA